MNALTPQARGRIAFTAIAISIYLIAADMTVASGDPPLALFLAAPALAVVATGRVKGREAVLRSVISALAAAAAGLVANLAHGRGVPDYHGFGILMNVMTGLVALNLAIIAAASYLLGRVWPASDHWTR